MQVPDWAWAFSAAALWAVSSLVISNGLEALRIQTDAETTTAARVVRVLVGVLLALTSGLLALSLATGFDVHFIADSRVVAAGLFTFPIATGLYYVTALSYNERADIAAQFANVKPLFSIALAAFIFQEALGIVDAVAIAVITVGVLLMFIAAAMGAESNGRTSLALGLLLAAAWASGEGFVRSVADEFGSAEIAFSGLAASAAAVLLVLLCIAAGVPGLRETQRFGERLHWLLPSRAHGAFLVHGVLSFGFAYALFFRSIATIGLARSAMVSAFWPALAIALRVWFGGRGGRVTDSIGGLRSLAFGLFLVGSLVSLLG